MKKKRFHYRRVNPKWCNFNLGLCHTWAGKEDKYCWDINGKKCEYNKKEVNN